MTTGTPGPQDVLARRLREVLASQQAVREVRMFGGLSFLVDERMAVAAGRDGDLLVRTDPARYDELLDRGAQPAHMGKDRRPMGRGWLRVRPEQLQDDDALRSWVQVGLDARGAVG